jgi:hypothetical protein
MGLRKVRNEDEARRYLAAVAASGRPRVEWARANGIDARSLNAWRMNLQGSRRRPDLRVVELVAEPPASRATWRVRCGAFEVEVPEDFEEGALGRLLRVVASC